MGNSESVNKMRGLYLISYDAAYTRLKQIRKSNRLCSITLMHNLYKLCTIRNTDIIPREKKLRNDKEKYGSNIFGETFLPKVGTSEEQWRKRYFCSIWHSRRCRDSKPYNISNMCHCLFWRGSGEEREIICRMENNVIIS